jgi:hypothetical protein
VPEGKGRVGFRPAWLHPPFSRSSRWHTRGTRERKNLSHPCIFPLRGTWAFRSNPNGEEVVF